MKEDPIEEENILTLALSYDQFGEESLAKQYYIDFLNRIDNSNNEEKNSPEIIELRNKIQNR